MIKEIKYIFYLLSIIAFFSLNLKYYVSDNFSKKFYRSLNSYESKVSEFSKELEFLKNDTNNIIEYIDNSKTEKKFQFWKLLNND